MTEISYHLPDDLVARARADGRPAVALWGPGWGYLKTADFHDWRILAERAEVYVHNLTDGPLDAYLVLDVKVTGGRKRIQVDGKAVVVPKTDGKQRLRIRQVFAPGARAVVLVDDLYDFGRVLLRVASIGVQVAEEGEAGAAGTVVPSPP